VAIRDLATGTSRQVTQGDWEKGYPDSPKISPDGKLIAYNWYPVGVPPDHDSGTMLRLVGTDGSDDRFLQSVGGMRSWSRDSRHIAARTHNLENTDTEIVLISVEDGAVTPLWTFHFRERFDLAVSHSPDDRFLAVEFPVEGDSARFDIALIPTGGGDLLPLVDHPANDQLIGWVPGTDMVLFASDRSGNTDLWAIPVSEAGEGGIPFPVRRNMDEGWPMGFASDGSFFYSVYTLQYVKRIAPFDEATGTILMEESEPLRGTHDNCESAWSPNGDRLVLAYREGERPDGEWFTIRVRDMRQGTERVLTRDINPGTVAGPKWTQDGRSILVVGMDGDTKRRDWPQTPSGLYRIGAETGESTRLFDFRPDGSWWSSIGFLPTSDGEGVTYIHDGRLVLRDLESGREEVLYRHPDLASQTLALSPDGSELVFGVADSTVTHGSPNARLEEGGHLMVMPSRGGQARELLTFQDPGGRVRGVKWTSDGLHIDLLIRGGRRGGAALLRVPREGGDPQRVWETDVRIGSFVPSPDGQWVTYYTQTNEAEIWVMENLRAALTEANPKR
jgi:Tol biopolymer transport system component